jgi:hypothetical protein
LTSFSRIFFGGSERACPWQDVMEDMSPEEAQMLAQMLRMFNEQLRKLMEKLLRGEQLSQQELEQLGQLTGLNRADDLRYKDWYTQRMMRALRFKEVQEAMREMMQMLEQMGMTKQRLDQLQRLIQANQQALQEQIGQFAGQKIAENMSERDPEGQQRGPTHGPPLPRPLRPRDGSMLPQRGAPAGQPPAQPHRPAPEARQERPTRRQSHHPHQPQARRRALRDQAPRPPPQVPSWSSSATSAPPCATAPS